MYDKTKKIPHSFHSVWLLTALRFTVVYFTHVHVTLLIYAQMHQLCNLCSLQCFTFKSSISIFTQPKG